MPTYEFRCPVGHDFEKFFRKMSDAPSELTCPVCGQVGARKVSGGAGLHFKGQGFYITDYGKDGKKGTPGAKPAEPAGGEAKPAEKPSDAAATPSSTAEPKPAPAKSPAPKE